MIVYLRTSSFRTTAITQRLTARMVSLFYRILQISLVGCGENDISWKPKSKFATVVRIIFIQSRSERCQEGVFVAGVSALKEFFGVFFFFPLLFFS